jgi:hypothetical protein
MSFDTLGNWEKYLKSKIATVRLIGEVGLSEEETRAIGKLIEYLIRGKGSEDATRTLGLHYSCTLATYLVFEGVYNYYLGDYWTSVCDTLKISHTYTTDLGQIFEAVLENYELPSQFYGHRYVSSILGHGGIPRFSLPNFFEKLLQPSVEEPRLSILPSSKLINRWSTEFLRGYANKPVQRFLETGGSIALEFIDRCREMAQETVYTGIIPLPHATGLPGMVVEEYRQWLTEYRKRPRQVLSKPPIYATQLRLKRPIVFFQPWEKGILLNFPPQVVPATETQNEIRWEMIYNHKKLVFPIHKYLKDEGYTTDELFEYLTDPAYICEVRLYMGELCLREWILDELVIKPQYPFLAFDVNSGELLSRRDALRAKPFWLLIPPHIKLEQNHLITEILPRLTDGWSTWQTVEIELQNTPYLYLVSSNGVLEFPVIDEGEPSLIGTPLLLKDQAIPIYVGDPPILSLPNKETIRLAEWRLELFNELDASPRRHIDRSIESLSKDSVIEEDKFFLPLNCQALLGTEPFGQYRLRVFDPLKRSSEFHFKVVPKLKIVGANTLYCPSKTGKISPITLLIEIDYKTELHSELEIDHVTISEITKDEASGTLYGINLPLGKINVRLLLIRVTKLSQVVIPLHITLQYLRWSLLLDRRLTGWQESTFLMSLEELKEYTEPYFIVDLPILDKKSTSAKLYVVDEYKNQLLELGHTGSLRAGLTRFDLRNIRETLRQTPASSFEMFLEIRQDEEKVIKQSVLRLTREIELHQLTIDAAWHGKSASVSIHWSPNSPIRSRCIRLWSQTQPWSAPVKLLLPDEANGHTKIVVNGFTLIPGQYIAEMFVEDPWIPTTLPSRPRLTDLRIKSLYLGSIKERIEALSLLNDAHFDIILERALLRYAISDLAGAKSDAEWCCHNLDQAHPTRQRPLFEAFSRLPEVKFQTLRLLEPVTLRIWLEAYASESIDTSTRQWFKHQLLFLIRQSGMPDVSRDLLLCFPEKEVQTAAAQKLIELGIPTGIKSVVTWVDEERISRDEALSLIEQNVTLALHQLSKLSPTPIVDELIGVLESKYMTKIQTMFLRRGNWIRTQAGWGTVERIESQSNPYCKFLSYDALDVYPIRIHVLLHGESASERIIFDTTDRYIEFIDTTEIYVCLKCGRWASSSQELLYYVHDHITHDGILSEFTPIQSNKLLQSDEPEFSCEKPQNIWE